MVFITVGKDKPQLCLQVFSDRLLSRRADDRINQYTRVLVDRWDIFPHGMFTVILHLWLSCCTAAWHKYVDECVYRGWNAVHCYGLLWWRYQCF